MRPFLDTLVDHLRELRVLDMVSLANGERQQQEMKMIKRLPNLRELVISLHWQSMYIPFPNIADRHLCIQRRFAESQHLQVVDFVRSWFGD
jgi:hypothetical protein